MHAEEQEWKDRFREVRRKEHELANLTDALAGKAAAIEVPFAILSI